MDAIQPVRTSSLAGGSTIYEANDTRKGIFEVSGEERVVKVKPSNTRLPSEDPSTCGTPRPIKRTLKNVRIENQTESLVAQLSSGITTEINQLSSLLTESLEIKPKPEEKPENAVGERIDNSCALVDWSEGALSCLANRSKNRDLLSASIRMRNLYANSDSILCKQLTQYEQWDAAGNTEDIRKHITERTEINVYDGPDYSVLCGENELKAKCFIKTGEIIAHYGGKLLTEQEFDDLCNEHNQLDFSPEDYAVGIPYAKLILDGSHGNQMHCINDGTREDDHGKKHKTRSNVEFFILFKKTKTKLGNVLVPRVYVVAKQDILQNERLWLCYGEEFWTGKQKAQKERQRLMNQSSMFVDNQSFKHCKRVKVDSTIPTILRLVLHEKHPREELPTLLCGKKSLNQVNKMFNRAIWLMTEAINEARWAGWLEKGISEAPGILALANWLGISGQQLCEYMNIYEKEFRFNKHVKAMLDTLLTGDFPTPWHLYKHPGISIKPQIISAYLQEFIEIYDSDGNAEVILDLLAKHYKVSKSSAQQWVQKSDSIRKMLRQPEPHSLERALNVNAQKVLKDLYINFYKQGIGHHSAAAKETIRAQSWPEGTRIDSVCSYLNDVSKLISSESHENIDTLLRLGFKDEQLSELSKPKETAQSNKRAIFVHFFSLFLKPEPLLTKDQAIQSTIKKFEGFICRKDLIEALTK